MEYHGTVTGRWSGKAIEGFKMQEPRKKVRKTKAMLARGRARRRPLLDDMGRSAAFIVALRYHGSV